MIMNEIGVVQNFYTDKMNQCRNEYHFYTKNGIYLGAILFPSNGQMLDDAYALNRITKYLAMRWGIVKQTK